MDTRGNLHRRPDPARLMRGVLVASPLTWSLGPSGVGSGSRSKGALPSRRPTRLHTRCRGWCVTSHVINTSLSDKGVGGWRERREGRCSAVRPGEPGRGGRLNTCSGENRIKIVADETTREPDLLRPTRLGWILDSWSCRDPPRLRTTTREVGVFRP